MIKMPSELQGPLIESNRLAAEIRLLRNKKRLSIANLRRFADLRVEMLALCPPTRFVWIDGLPVADILKTLHQQTERKNDL